MRRYFVLVPILLAVGHALGNDLSRLYELALTRDTALQISAAARDAAIEARPQALAPLLPQVSASASAVRDRLTYDATQIGVNTTDCTAYAGGAMQRCYGNTRQFGVTLSQTLWSFQSFNQLKEADLQAAAAEATFSEDRQNLLLRVAQAYFAILSASDQLSTNRSEREAFGTLLNQAKVRAQTGVSPRSDVEQAQAFFDATEQDVIDAQNALDDADLGMTEIVGPQASAIAPLREDIPLNLPDPATVEDWVASARQDNFAVRAASLKVAAAERDIAAERGKGLPTLALVGSSSKASSDPVLGGHQTVNSIGVSFNWPLYQGGAVASAVHRSRALYRQTQAELESLLRDTERQTRAAFRSVVSGVQRIGAARRAVASGRIAVEASRHKVEFGAGTEFDLLNAQNNYYAAIRAYNQARYDYLTGMLTLKQQAGRLTKQDIMAIDALLVESHP